MSNDRIKKVTSSTGSLPPVLLDLTADTVSQSNLQKDETAHNNEGYPITGQMAIEDAEAWAVGTKNGVPVSEEDIQFNNNSKYYAAVSGSIMRIAGQQALAAATSANNAASSASEAADSAVISGSYMRIAGEYKDEAAASAERAEDSEAWAVGKRDGTDVPPSDPTYHNNSKYWADQAKAYGTGGVHYIASVLFENIPVSGMASGDMYNIEDDFTTDERFQEGAGVKVKAGANIIYNAYGKWDVEATGGGNDDLIANTENGNTATHAYTKGQQFIKEDKLYKAVKDIAVGDVLAPATPVNPVSFTLEQADYITKMRVYSSATDYIDYFPSGGKLENITLYTNQRVVLYHSASSKWGYMFVNPYRYVDLEVGETSYFIVPNNATGDSATIMQRAEEPATGISVDNFTIGESAFLGTYGWVKDVTGLVMGEGSPIENGNYVESEKITDQIQIFKGVNGSIASIGGILPPAPMGGEEKIFRGKGGWDEDYTRSGKKEGSTLGIQATAEGANNISSGNYAHAEGIATTAQGNHSHSEGHATLAYGTSAHTEGQETKAIGHYSHSEGIRTTADALYSHSEGTDTCSHGDASHSEGSYSTAYGGSSHSEGDGCKAFGVDSHSEGYHTYAVGDKSHTEGTETTALNDSCHSEGYQTVASGAYSHSEGQGCVALDARAHAEGEHTTASGIASHAAGYHTSAGYDCQTVVGQYNDNKSNTLFEVGNGTSNSARSNAFEVYFNGDVKANGAIIKRLQSKRVTHKLSDYNKSNSWYAVPAPTDHDYLFVTLFDWGSSGTSTSPFTLAFGKPSAGTNFLWVIVGSIEPKSVVVDYWYYD